MNGLSFPRRGRVLTVVTLAAALTLITSSAATAATQLVPGTAVLLSQNGGSGNGGNTSSTTSRTNIFSPSAYVDYKRFGAEPTVVVDRYPFSSGPTYRDLAYASAPIGVPEFSYFYKSDDLGKTFRLTEHLPAYGEGEGALGGGGDSHLAIGQVTHKVFFADLPLHCVNMNISTDFGESWGSRDPLACGLNPGVDDRQWVAVDEAFPGDAPPTTGHVYVSFIQFAACATLCPALSVARSLQDGDTGSFVTGSTCNSGTIAVGAAPQPGMNVFANDATPTPCPDPTDTRLWVAGPPVVDDERVGTAAPSHRIYIPFIRANNAMSGGPPWDLYVAISNDGGSSWTRQLVAQRGTNNPDNIFPVLTVDRGGNLYYMWSEGKGGTGEQDIFYSYSLHTSTTPGGTAWSAPINLTPEKNDTAVLPWLVAGDPGQVDAVFYKSNTGLNSNTAFTDQNGGLCSNTSGPGCPVWNVYFAQSQNALNSGSNFKTVQISDHPNHIGQVCTAGLSCSGDRDLLDFFTVDIDHLGAANVSWADDNYGLGFGRSKFSRQVSGNSVYKNQPITLTNTWPITDHSVTDRPEDVYDGTGAPNDSCAGMDVLGTSEKFANGRINVSMLLNSAPTALKAATCSGTAASGGVWGAEFWAAGGPNKADNFYVAYRDNPPDGGPRVEGGTIDDVNVTVTSLEFHPQVLGSPDASSIGGTCFTPAGAPTSTAPCTITMSVSAAALGIKSGAGLYSITGVSTYFTGSTALDPITLLCACNSEQADAATAFDDNGTGTTAK